MRENIFDKVKNTITIAEVCQRYGIELSSKDMACCPFPNHHDSSPSFSIKRSENYFKCFGCEESGDIIRLVELLFDLTPIEAANKLASDFNIAVERESTTALPTRKPKAVAKPIECNASQIKEYIMRCAEDVALTDYFTKRGLTQQTIKRFNLGYDKAKDVVVMPYNRQLTYYSTRSTTNKAFYKPNSDVAGNEPLFNGNALNGKQPVFVVESPLCAMSIAQCGAQAVALCGVHAIKLIEALKESQFEQPLILSLDNDNAGQEGCKKLSHELLKLDVSYLCNNIAGTCKDPNELLAINANMLAENVKSALQLASKKTTRIGTKKSISTRELMSMNLPEIEWLVEDILPVGLQLIAAPSKIGKSWMMLQLSEALASGGTFLGKQCKQCEVIYFALEDTPSRFKSRLLRLLKGKLPQHGNHVRMQVGNLDNGLFEDVESELKAHPNTKLLIFDTLQFIRGTAKKNEGVYATDCRELKLLKNFADAHGVAMLLVHHLRKMSDSDSFNRISGSTGLMGTCDNTYLITKDSRDEDTASFEITGRDICHNVLKIRQDSETSAWLVVAEGEELERQKQQESYANNDIVKVIKMLLTASPHGWEDTINEFAKQASFYLGYALPYVPNKLSAAITALDNQLAVDGILHKAPTGGGRKGRNHCFQYMKNVTKQVAIFGGDESIEERERQVEFNNFEIADDFVIPDNYEPTDGFVMYDDE